MKVFIIMIWFCGNLWAAPDTNWSFNTLVKVMEEKGFHQWQRGDKLFMKGLLYAKERGIDITESGVMDSLVIKNGGLYFKKDPVSLSFSPRLIREALRAF